MLRSGFYLFFSRLSVRREDSANKCERRVFMGIRLISGTGRLQVQFFPLAFGLGIG